MDFLPDFILVDILSYLDYQNLLVATEVCQRWANIISTSSTLKRRFKLTIFLRKNSYLIFRRFPSEINENITIDMSAPCKHIHPEMRNLLEKQTNYLKSLTLFNFFEVNAFQVLKITRNITKLILINIRHEDTEELLELPNLQHLELVNSLGIAKFITTTHNLKTIKIMGALSILMEKKRNDIRYEESSVREGYSTELCNFLSRCVNLKELWFSTYSSDVILNCSQFSFNLTTLMVENYQISEENLIEFLENQKSSLKNYSMMTDKKKVHLLNFLLFKMNLEELEIDVVIIPTDFEPKENKSGIKRLAFKSFKVQEYLRQQRFNIEHHDYKDQRDYFDNVQIDFGFVKNKSRVFPNRDDRDYFIAPHFLNHWDRREENGHAESSALVRKILSACPALESAIFYNLYCPQFIDQLNESCKNLKVLKLFEVPKTISSDILLEDLEVMEIDHMDFAKGDVVNYLLILTSKCPKLRSLKIHDFDDSYDDKLFDIISVNKNVEELHIGNAYTYLSDITEAVKKAKQQGSNLKKLSFVVNFPGKDRSRMEFYGVEITFHPMFRKVFNSIYFDCRVGSFRRRMATKIAKLREICFKALNEDQYG